MIGISQIINQRLRDGGADLVICGTSTIFYLVFAPHIKSFLAFNLFFGKSKPYFLAHLSVSPKVASLALKKFRCGAPDHPFLLPDINNGIFYKSRSIPSQGGEAKGEILGGTGGGGVLQGEWGLRSDTKG